MSIIIIMIYGIDSFFEALFNISSEEQQISLKTSKAKERSERAHTHFTNRFVPVRNIGIRT